MLYLTDLTWQNSILLKFFNFLPQCLLMLVFSYYLHDNIEICLFFITYAFVTFNKVCTSQVTWIFEKLLAFKYILIIFKVFCLVFVPYSDNNTKVKNIDPQFNLNFPLMASGTSNCKIILYDNLFYSKIILVLKAIWLFYAFKLEFRGENTFLELWLASILFAAINCFIMKYAFLDTYAFYDLRAQNEQRIIKKKIN